jgi:hypothetical protein
LATELGWTYSDIDDLSLNDVDELMEYWKESPPVPMLVRAYMGFGKKEKPKKADKKSLAEFAKMLGG